MKQWLNILLPKIYGLAFTVFALFLLFTNGKDVLLQMRSQSWPKAEGKGLMSRVDERGEASGGRTNRTYRVHVPVIAYEYEVDGQVFRSGRFKFGVEAFDSSSEARGFLLRFAENEKILVRYNPRNHSVSVLDTSMRQKESISMLFGFGLLAIGIVGLVPIRWLPPALLNFGKNPNKKLPASTNAPTEPPA
ncbi:MAG: DUF3592 domain-containing protein [Pirellulaceae bacterium]